MVSLLAAAKLSKNETMAMITTAILYHPSGCVYVFIIVVLGSVLLMTISSPCFFIKKWWTSRYSETFCTRKLTARKPTIVTYCKVYETNVPWYRKKQVIWRETKSFRFTYWVDVTDPNMNLDYYSFLTASFEIDFADDETERAYQELKTIKDVDGNPPIFYQTTRMKVVLLTLLAIMPVSFVVLPPLYLMYRKGMFNRFSKQITIKKLVTVTNIEVSL